jgi:hypothetical protein
MSAMMPHTYMVAALLAICKEVLLQDNLVQKYRKRDCKMWKKRKSVGEFSILFGLIR